MKPQDKLEKVVEKQLDPVGWLAMADRAEEADDVGRAMYWRRRVLLGELVDYSEVMPSSMWGNNPDRHSYVYFAFGEAMVKVHRGPLMKGRTFQVGRWKEVWPGRWIVAWFFPHYGWYEATSFLHGVTTDKQKLTVIRRLERRIDRVKKEVCNEEAS